MPENLACRRAGSRRVHFSQRPKAACASAAEGLPSGSGVKGPVIGGRIFEGGGDGSRDQGSHSAHYQLSFMRLRMKRYSIRDEGFASPL